MQRVTLLCIGSLKISWCLSGCDDYIGRIQRAMKLDIVELPASKERDADRQREEESQRLLDALSKREGRVWVLDERGKAMTSPAFSADLQLIGHRGDSLIVVLGGAYGLTDPVRAKADRLLSFSMMTLPHELCRLVFLEQLYRAAQIARGSDYHHY